jgi:hypothetical protein
MDMMKGKKKGAGGMGILAKMKKKQETDEKLSVWANHAIGATNVQAAAAHAYSMRKTFFVADAASCSGGSKLFRRQRRMRIRCVRMRT